MDTRLRRTLPLVNLEPLAVAAAIVAALAFGLVLYWASVAFLAALEAEERELAERWLIVVGGLLVLAILSAVYGSDAIRLGLAAIAGYLVIRGPWARRA